jgi:rSAM/selenodomain-associated transferase 1
MAKAPRAGHVKTRLTPPLAPEQACALYRSMLTDTVRLSREAGVDVAAMVPSSDSVDVAAIVGSGVDVVAQVGRGLADALAFVFETFAARGYARIAAIDSDSPTLPPPHLRDAFALLDRHDVVLGPTPDGGYYLVGAQRPQPGLFAPSDLGTSSALQAVEHAAAARRLSCARAAEWYDVDTAGDLPRLNRDLLDDPARAPATAALLASWRRDKRLDALLQERVE